MVEKTSDAMNLDLSLGPGSEPASATMSNVPVSLENLIDQPIHQTAEVIGIGSYPPQSELESSNGLLNTILTSQALPREQNQVAPTEVVDLTQDNVTGLDTAGNRRLQSWLLGRTQTHKATLSSLSSALSTAETLVEAYFHNHLQARTPAVRNQEPPQPVSDQDSFSIIQAVINSESQMDTVVETPVPPEGEDIVTSLDTGENLRLQSLLLGRTQTHRDTLSSLSSALTSAERLVEAYFHKHPHPSTPAVRNQEPPQPVGDRDSFSSIQAVINSEKEKEKTELKASSAVPPKQCCL